MIEAIFLFLLSVIAWGAIGVVCLVALSFLVSFGIYLWMGTHEKSALQFYKWTETNKYVNWFLNDIPLNSGKFSNP